MHVEEIAFHLAVPIIMLATVAAMGYYVTMLFVDIFKIA
jgi:hypothetical protein